MRKKILNHTCLLVVLSVLMTFLAASLVMYSKYNEDLKQSVRDSTKYIQDSVEKMGESYLDKDLGKASAARITLLDSEGNVLFDSLEDPMELANHSNRPEFIQAEKEGYAETLRYSETLSKQNFPMEISSVWEERQTVSFRQWSPVRHFLVRFCF